MFLYLFIPDLDLEIELLSPCSWPTRHMQSANIISGPINMFSHVNQMYKQTNFLTYANRIGRQMSYATTIAFLQTNILTDKDYADRYHVIQTEAILQTAISTLYIQRSCRKTLTLTFAP